MRKNNHHRRLLPILIAFVGLLVATATPAAQGARAAGGRAEAHRIVRVSQTPAGPAVHQVVLFQLERAVRTFIEIIADPNAPSIGTHTVSDDPDPTSETPIHVPGDPGDEDGDGQDGIPRLKDSADQPNVPGSRPTMGTLELGI